MSFETDLAVLSSDLVDDLEVGLEEGQEYNDASAPAPLKAGNYVLRITKLAAAKDKDGNAVVTKREKGSFPVLEITAQVAEPVELEGRQAVSFFRVYSVPFDRQGVPASGLMDLIRSFSPDPLPRSIGAQIERLRELAETSTFRGLVEWEAYDKDFANAQTEAAGGKSSLSKDQVKAIQKAATIKGMKKFPQDNNGNFIPTIKHPVSGNDLEARTTVNFIPASRPNVKIAA